MEPAENLEILSHANVHAAHNVTIFIVNLQVKLTYQENTTTEPSIQCLLSRSLRLEKSG